MQRLLRTTLWLLYAGVVVECCSNKRRQEIELQCLHVLRCNWEHVTYHHYPPKKKKSAFAISCVLFIAGNWKITLTPIVWSLSQKLFFHPFTKTYFGSWYCLQQEKCEKNHKRSTVIVLAATVLLHHRADHCWLPVGWREWGEGEGRGCSPSAGARSAR